jgi:hypothetical protein
MDIGPYIGMWIEIAMHIHPKAVLASTNHVGVFQAERPTPTVGRTHRHARIGPEGIDRHWSVAGQVRHCGIRAGPCQRRSQAAALTSGL